MKKSQAELLIAECLIEPHHEDVMKEAAYILAKLEKFGLTPPSSMTNINGETTYYLNKWEPEE